MIPTRPPSGVPSRRCRHRAGRGGAAEHRIGPLLWRPSARPGRGTRWAPTAAPRRDGRCLPDGGAAPHSACRRPGRSSPDRGGARAAGVQGAGRGGPLPRARAAPDGRHRPAPSRDRPPVRPRRPRRGGAGRSPGSGGVEHYDTVLVHEHVPSFSLEVHYGLERASQRVTAARPRGALGAARAAGLCGHPGLRAGAGRRAGRAGRARRKTLPRLHAAHVDRRPGDDRQWRSRRGAGGLGRRACRGGGGPVPHRRRCRARAGPARVGVDSPSELFPLPSRGWRGQALRQLFSVTWPLDGTRVAPLSPHLRVDRRARRSA